MRVRRSLWVLGALCLAAFQAPAQPVPQPARVDRFGDPLPAGAVARLGSVRFHHPGGVIAAVFAPDGKTILVAGMEKKGLSLRFWESATGKEQTRFAVENADLTGLAFTPDGKGVL